MQGSPASFSSPAKKAWSAESPQEYFNSAGFAKSARTQMQKIPGHAHLQGEVRPLTFIDQTVPEMAKAQMLASESLKKMREDKDTYFPNHKDVILCVGSMLELFIEGDKNDIKKCAPPEKGFQIDRSHGIVGKYYVQGVTPAWPLVLKQYVVNIDSKVANSLAGLSVQYKENRSVRTKEFNGYRLRQRTCLGLSSVGRICNVVELVSTLFDNTAACMAAMRGLPTKDGWLQVSELVQQWNTLWGEQVLVTVENEAALEKLLEEVEDYWDVVNGDASTEQLKSVLARRTIGALAPPAQDPNEEAKVQEKDAEPREGPAVAPDEVAAGTGYVPSAQLRLTGTYGDFVELAQRNTMLHGGDTSSMPGSPPDPRWVEKHRDAIMRARKAMQAREKQGPPHKSGSQQHDKQKQKAKSITTRGKVAQSPTRRGGKGGGGTEGSKETPPSKTSRSEKKMQGTVLSTTPEPKKTPVGSPGGETGGQSTKAGSPANDDIMEDLEDMVSLEGVQNATRVREGKLEADQMHVVRVLLVSDQGDGHEGKLGVRPSYVSRAAPSSIVREALVVYNVVTTTDEEGNAVGHHKTLVEFAYPIDEQYPKGMPVTRLMELVAMECELVAPKVVVADISKAFADIGLGYPVFMVGLPRVELRQMAKAVYDATYFPVKLVSPLAGANSWADFECEEVAEAEADWTEELKEVVICTTNLILKRKRCVANATKAFVDTKYASVDVQAVKKFFAKHKQALQWMGENVSDCVGYGRDVEVLQDAVQVGQDDTILKWARVVILASHARVRNGVFEVMGDVLGGVGEAARMAYDLWKAVKGGNKAGWRTLAPLPMGHGKVVVTDKLEMKVEMMDMMHEAMVLATKEIRLYKGRKGLLFDTKVAAVRNKRVRELLERYECDSVRALGDTLVLVTAEVLEGLGEGGLPAVGPYNQLHTLVNITDASGYNTGAAGDDLLAAEAELSYVSTILQIARLGTRNEQREDSAEEEVEESGEDEDSTEEIGERLAENIEGYGADIELAPAAAGLARTTKDAHRTLLGNGGQGDDGAHEKDIAVTVGRQVYALAVLCRAIDRVAGSRVYEGIGSGLEAVRHCQIEAPTGRFNVEAPDEMAAMAAQASKMVGMLVVDSITADIDMADEDAEEMTSWAVQAVGASIKMAEVRGVSWREVVDAGHEDAKSAHEQTTRGPAVSSRTREGDRVSYAEQSSQECERADSEDEAAKYDAVDAVLSTSVMKGLKGDVRRRVVHELMDCAQSLPDFLGSEVVREVFTDRSGQPLPLARLESMLEPLHKEGAAALAACDASDGGEGVGAGAAGEEEDDEEVSTPVYIKMCMSEELRSFVDDMLIRNHGDVGHVVREAEKAGHDKVDAGMVAECLELLDARGRMPAKNNRTMHKVKRQFEAKSPMGPSGIHAFEKEQADEDAKKQEMIDRTAPVREAMKAEADKRYARQLAKAAKRMKEREAEQEKEMRAEEHEEQRKKDKRAQRLSEKAQEHMRERIARSIANDKKKETMEGAAGAAAAEKMTAKRVKQLEAEIAALKGEDDKGARRKLGATFDELQSPPPPPPPTKGGGGGMLAALRRAREMSGSGSGSASDSDGGAGIEGSVKIRVIGFPVTKEEVAAWEAGTQKEHIRMELLPLLQEACQSTFDIAGIERLHNTMSGLYPAPLETSLANTAADVDFTCTLATAKLLMEVGRQALWAMNAESGSEVWLKVMERGGGGKGKGKGKGKGRW